MARDAGRVTSEKFFPVCILGGGRESEGTRSEILRPPTRGEGIGEECQLHRLNGDLSGIEDP